VIRKVASSPFAVRELGNRQCSNLDGTIDVVPTDPAPLNTLFAYRIVRVALHSKSYSVGGNQGTIMATALDPTPRLAATATVTINGQEVELSSVEGGADTFTTDSPPSFRGLLLVGEPGFALGIWAAPQA
jgi:hypothetical protein